MNIFKKRIRDKPEMRSSELDEFIRGEDLHGGVNSGLTKDLVEIMESDLFINHYII
ncbi:MAG: hypothetical protein R3Y32_07075 [Bacillota bacterium]